MISYAVFVVIVILLLAITLGGVVGLEWFIITYLGLETKHLALALLAIMAVSLLKKEL